MARLYEGVVSPSSGGSVVDNGDVRTDRDLIEAKTTGEVGKPARKTVLIKTFEKVAKEAWAEGLEPVVALRYFLPDSILAQSDGWVDLSVRLVCDDALRT